jgi:hypothetical protein
MTALLRSGGEAPRSALASREQGHHRCAGPGVACGVQPGDVLASPYDEAIAALFRSNFADCFVVETLVLLFRSSHQFAAHPSANFGIKGALEISTSSSAAHEI